MTRHVWLVRHGMREDFMRPEWRETAERPDDTPLSAEGRQQARETGMFLRDKGVEVIYTSPFIRAVETAGGIATVLGVPIRIEAGLSEALKAEWFSGQPDFIPAADLQRQFRHIDLSYTSRVWPRYPESEENGEVGQRCKQALESMLADEWQGALLVGHGASVAGIGGALAGHCADVCFKMCGLSGWSGHPGNWTSVYSGVDHLSFSEDALRFH